MKKRGLSEVISVILFILLGIILIAIVSMVILRNIKNTEQDIELTQILGLENSRIEKATGDFENGGVINITIKRVSSLAEKSTTNYQQSIQEKIPIEIVLVLDRSGSMRQSGWNLETSLSPTYTTTLIVPRNAYSPSYTFSVPAGTTRLAISTNWAKIPGLNGSEASEFATNLRRPSGTWIANAGGTPNDLGGKVDPPDSIGTALEYFSGISTKPQYFYIENPQSGNWRVNVYGWNLRPRTSPPPSQNVSVSIYLGNSTNLNKSATILSSDTVKSASKDFIDTLGEEDRVAIVRFGSYAQLTQGLTLDKALAKSAIDNIGSEGGTYINTGIDTATQHLISNGESGTFKVITVLTDGQNDIGPQPVIDSAKIAKDNNFTIFTIGLTNFVDEDLLRNIATEPDYYYYSDFDKLNDIYEQLSEKIISIQETKTVGVSFVILFLNNQTSCQKEISASELPDLASIKTFRIDLEGCVKNITRIEIYPKIKGKIGTIIDSIDISP